MFYFIKCLILFLISANTIATGGRLIKFSGGGHETDAIIVDSINDHGTVVARHELKISQFHGYGVRSFNEVFYGSKGEIFLGTNKGVFKIHCFKNTLYVISQATGFLLFTNDEPKIEYSDYTSNNNYRTALRSYHQRLLRGAEIAAVADVEMTREDLFVVALLTTRKKESQGEDGIKRVNIEQAYDFFEGLMEKDLRWEVGEKIGVCRLAYFDDLSLDSVDRLSGALVDGFSFYLRRYFYRNKKLKSNRYVKLIKDNEYYKCLTERQLDSATEYLKIWLLEKASGSRVESI